MRDIDADLPHAFDQRRQPVERCVHLADQRVDIVAPPRSGDPRRQFPPADPMHGRRDAVEPPLPARRDHHAGDEDQRHQQPAGPGEAHQGQPPDRFGFAIAGADQQRIAAHLAAEDAIVVTIVGHSQGTRAHRCPAAAGRHHGDIAGQHRAGLVGQGIDPFMPEGRTRMAAHRIAEIGDVVLAVGLADDGERVGHRLVHPRRQLLPDQFEGDEPGDGERYEEGGAEQNREPERRAAQEVATHACCIRCCAPYGARGDRTACRSWRAAG